MCNADFAEHFSITFFFRLNGMMVVNALGKSAARWILWEKTQTSGFRGHLKPSFKDNVSHCAWTVLLDKDIK